MRPLAVLALLFAALPSARAETPLLDRIGREIQGVLENHRSSIVRVCSSRPGRLVSGSGFFLDTTGTVVTASALIHPGETVWIEFGGAKHPAELVAADRRSSVAILRTDARGAPVRLTEAAPCQAGSPVVALGFPYDREAAPAFGFVASLDAQAPDQRYFCTTHIRADLRLIPGMLGGPLMNTQGEVVGLITGSLDRGLNSYALPADALLRVAGDLRAHGRVRAGWLGIAVAPPGDAAAKPGPVVVEGVVPEAPAAASDIQPGDILVRIGKDSVRDPGDVRRASFLAGIGQSMEIVLNRAGREIRVEIPVAERPGTDGGEPTSLDPAVATVHAEVTDIPMPPPPAP